MQVTTATETITAEAICAMTDAEIAMHASGSYGPGKRIRMIAAIRRLAAGAEIKDPPPPRAA